MVLYVLTSRPMDAIKGQNALLSYDSAITHVIYPVRPFFPYIPRWHCVGVGQGHAISEVRFSCTI